MSRYFERQEQEIKERRCRRAEEKRVQQEEDEQVVMAMGFLDLESQGRRHGSQVSRGPNVDRYRHSRGQYRMQPHLFNKVMHDVCNYDAYFIHKCDASGVLGLLSEQKLTTVIRMLERFHQSTGARAKQGPTQASASSRPSLPRQGVGPT
ncbi:unnamed protein product [Prunus armeniaca]